jgi:hypothetical protein
MANTIQIAMISSMARLATAHSCRGRPSI